MKSQLKNARWLFILCFLIVETALAEQIQVGHIAFSKGSNAAQLPDQPPRLLGKGVVVYLGDNIQTSTGSFIVILFDDGTRVTVRPNTSFSIDEYINNTDNKKAVLQLHKGGLKTRNGKIANKEPGQYQIKTSLGTVDAQQGEYSVRLCQKDCADEDEKSGKNPKIPKQFVMARAVEVKGSINAINKKVLKDRKRPLAFGAPIYSVDKLFSGQKSHALLAFRDGGRITLQENSEMDISLYDFQDKKQNDKAFFSLVSGGLRAMSGKIGKIDHSAYNINTPVSTIGIRGTGYDLYCVGEDCKQSNSKQNKTEVQQIKKGKANGLYSKVWEGTIVQKNAIIRTELSAPAINYIANEQTPPVVLKQAPVFFTKNPAIRPDKPKIDLDHVFGAVKLEGTPPGLYIDTRDGHLRIAGKNTSLNLGKNELAYIDPKGDLVRVKRIRPFQYDDSDSFLFSLLVDDEVHLGEGEDYVCVCE